MKPFRMLIAIAIGLMLVLPQSVDAKRGRKGAKTAGSGDAMNSPMRPDSPRHVQENAGLFNTGLTPIYPEGATCLEVKSFFGDTTRYDGSTRARRANNGYHEGFDISADEGTPIIAIAAGEVVHKFTGGRLVGHQIILRYAPADTGLPVWIFSKYKHFDALPAIEIGARVEMGQVLGPSGKTGTTGGYFGAAGYPHLHMSVYVNDTGEPQRCALTRSARGLPDAAETVRQPHRQGPPRRREVRSNSLQDRRRHRRAGRNQSGLAVHVRFSVGRRFLRRLVPNRQDGFAFQEAQAIECHVGIQINRRIRPTEHPLPRQNR